METTNVSTIGLPIAFSSGAGFIIPDPLKDGVYTFFAECQPMTEGGFPAPYCGPLVFGTVEPITLVKVAGINNISSAIVNNTLGHENFVSVTGQMAQGGTYPIILKGNTVGNYSNTFVVFIDWNQNHILNDAGEVYVMDQELINSTGSDGIQIDGNIGVPANALIGTTRMRVKKTLLSPELPVDPCFPESSWGQVEDYTINVTQGTGVSENNRLFGFSFYPNPSSNIVYFHSAENIESVSLFNLLGQMLQTQKVEAISSSINISHLNAGTYILKVIVNGQIGVYKIMKK